MNDMVEARIALARRTANHFYRRGVAEEIRRQTDRLRETYPARIVVTDSGEFDRRERAAARREFVGWMAGRAA